MAVYARYSGKTFLIQAILNAEKPKSNLIEQQIPMYQASGSFIVFIESERKCSGRIGS